MRTLLLYSYYTDQLSYFDDWIDVFKNHAEFEVICFNLSENSRAVTKNYFIHPAAYREIVRLIEHVDLIVLHHSMSGDTLKFVAPFISALNNRKGKLVCFVGNEVNLLSMGMAPKIKLLRKLNADIIATQLLLEAGTWLYQKCRNSNVISLPHALNPLKFYSRTSIKDRKIDIGTRSNRYGAYLGDEDRNEIIRHFHENSYGLNIDLGLNQGATARFDRNGWRNFLDNCKATLATEAGSFYLQPNDEIMKNIKKYLLRQTLKSNLSEETLVQKLFRFVIPLSLENLFVRHKRNYEVEIDSENIKADFREIYDRFFAQAERPPVYTKCISSRHFEAVGTRTFQIMYPGRYNDILIPNEHYFELQKDHANIQELLSLLKNPKKIDVMTSSTYEHVLNNHTHKHRLDNLLEFI